MLNSKKKINYLKNKVLRIPKGIGMTWKKKTI